MPGPIGNSAAILVTGASTGIGEACALALDRQGFRVFAAVRSESAAARLQQAASGQLVPLILDVTDEASIAAAAQRVRAAVGESGLAGLVNNAGIAVCGPLELLPIDRLRNQFEVNVLGQIAVTQAMLPLLRIAKGRIVNISSLNGAISPPYYGPYSASKFAMEALSDALRGELRRWGIHVSIVVPAQVKTPIWEKSLSAADRMADAVPPEALEPYRSDLDAVRRSAEKAVHAAMPIEWVVRSVVRALTAKRPKIRYYITWRTRLIFRAFRMLPDRVSDWVIRRELGIS